MCIHVTFIDTGPQPGLLPNHKQSVLLFLDRVYGIDSQEMLFHFLEQSFLPDLRAATMMDSVTLAQLPRHCILLASSA